MRCPNCKKIKLVKDKTLCSKCQDFVDTLARNQRKEFEIASNEAQMIAWEAKWARKRGEI